MSRFSKNHADDDFEGGELNLVPYLDIMVNLIMFMLVAVSYLAELKLIDILAPNYGADAKGQSEKTEEDRSLTLAVTQTGFTILSSDATLGKHLIPMQGKNYDFKALSAKLGEIKSLGRISPTLVVVASPEIAYDTVVATLDAARTDGKRKLFEDVSFGQVYTGK